MMDLSDQKQRIERLTPLNEVLNRIDQLVMPVASHCQPLLAALHYTLAADVSVNEQHPAQAIAWRDGWALRAEETADAGSYAPAMLSVKPARVDIGDRLPANTDAVAPLDAVKFSPAGFEALAPIVHGDGVLQAGNDVSAGEILCRAGSKVRAIDLAVLHAVGVQKVSVRVPRVSLVSAHEIRNSLDDAFLNYLSQMIGAAGCSVAHHEQLGNALSIKDSADLIILIGGTGMGRRDRSIVMLESAGKLEIHGIGISPGETTAFGFIGSTPILLLPGRADGALAAWLLIGRHVANRLCNRSENEVTIPAILTKKISSSLGLVEITPVHCERDRTNPLASGNLPLASLAHANGFVVIPADSEGFPEGTRVQVRPWQ